MTDIAKILPIQSIQDDCLINGNGDVTLGFSLDLPEIFTLKADEAETMHSSYLSLIKNLPSGTLVHMQNFFVVSKYEKQDESIDNYVIRSNKAYYDQKPILNQTTRIYFTFPTNSKSKGKNSLYSESDYVFNKPFRDLDKIRDFIESNEDNIMNSLNAVKHTKAVRMKNDELLKELNRYLNLDHEIKSKNGNYDIQPYQIEKDFIKIGEKYVAVISLNEEGNKLHNMKMPETSPGFSYQDGIEYNNEINMPASMVYPITAGLPVDHVVNYYVEIIDVQQAILNCKIEDSKVNFIATLGNEQAKAKQADIKKFIDTVSNHGYQTAETGLNVILFSEDEKKLKKNIELTKLAFTKMNDSKAWVENYDLTNIFFASCPGNLRLNERRFINVVDQSICYLNKEGMYKSDPEGLLFNDRFGKPVYLNIWDSNHIVNRNMVVFGPSGSGKSHWVNGYIDQSIATGMDITVIDVGGSYKRNCEINDGYYFDTADQRNLSFNIFLCKQDKEGKYIYKSADDDGEGAEDVVNFVYTVLKNIWKGKEQIRNEERAILKKMIESFYDHVNDKKIFPDFIEFYNYIDKFQKQIPSVENNYLDFHSLKLLLKPFYDGIHKGILNSKKRLLLADQKYIVFDLKGVEKNEDLRELILIIIMQISWDKMEKDLGLKKVIIIDEAIDSLKGDIGDFIGAGYRKVRKSNGAMAIATQGISYLEEVEELVRKSIFGNSDIIVLLNHENDTQSYPLFQKYLSMTDHDLELAKSLKDKKEKGGYREFFIKMGNYSKVYRNQVSLQANAAYSTTATEVGQLEEINSKTGNWKSAINTYVENEN